MQHLGCVLTEFYDDVLNI